MQLMAASPDVVEEAEVIEVEVASHNTQIHDVREEAEVIWDEEDEAPHYNIYLGDAVDGERSLWSSVLSRAILDYELGASASGHAQNEREKTKAALYLQARAWFYDDDSSDIGSFRWVCTVLGLGNPAELREKIEQYIEEDDDEGD